MLKKGDFKMPTKELIKDETLAANSLRTLSQKSLMEMVKTNEKLGLIVNNELEIAMLSWEKYEEIVDLVHRQEQRIEELECLVEDVVLSHNYGESIIKVEQGVRDRFLVNSIDEAFKMLDK